ncbi:helix-turn-helix transcriptional regulator [Leifsonia sp. ZF2019]|uniref:helix-turn-helix transcriptional regulator n=1 Tax=Leifsonia sp. ZF2019 TaxID=2781978 RepID=UPI001CBBC343|nr:helix-turn-helix domain-containing protein [Leifsonia sp. ZF2019]
METAVRQYDSVDDLPALATVTVLTAFLDVSVATLARWRQKRMGPPWVRVGGSAVRYPREGIREWLAANEHGTVQEDK